MAALCGGVKVILSFFRHGEEAAVKFIVRPLTKKKKESPTNSAWLS